MWTALSNIEIYAVDSFSKKLQFFCVQTTVKLGAIFDSEPTVSSVHVKGISFNNVELLKIKRTRIHQSVRFVQSRGVDVGTEKLCD